MSDLGLIERGRNDAKKADKQRRIREAASTLFSKKGYDATTIRQIARRAGVALGTVSLYAKDKRDLVLLIFNHEIDGTFERGVAAAERKTALLDKLIAFFGVFNEHFAENLTFARIHFQLNHYSSGLHSDEYYRQRRRVSDFLENVIREAQASGEIVKAEDPAMIAKLLFHIRSSNSRWWIAAEKPDLDAGLKELRRLFALVLAGLSPSSTTSRTRRTSATSR